jgi:hypothetical protein
MLLVFDPILPFDGDRIVIGGISAGGPLVRQKRRGIVGEESRLISGGLRNDVLVDGWARERAGA